MKRSIVVLCALFAGFAATAGAQVQGQDQAPTPASAPAQAPAQASAPASGSFTMQCNPVLVSYLFTSTEEIMAYLCQTDAKINGVAFTGLAFSQVSLINSSESEDRGVFVGALANGDQVFFEFQGSSRRTSNTTTVATMSYKIVGGTGSANGISGSGNCNETGTIGQAHEQTCVGTYALR
jgi:hypothetical protein